MRGSSAVVGLDSGWMITPSKAVAAASLPCAECRSRSSHPESLRRHVRPLSALSKMLVEVEPSARMLWLRGSYRSCTTLERGSEAAYSQELPRLALRKAPSGAAI